MTDVAMLTSLRGEALHDLFDERVCAVRVANFISAELAEKLNAWFLRNDAIEDYHHEMVVDGELKTFHYGVDRIGTPYNLTYGKPPESPARQKYYTEALGAIRRVRQAAFPEMSPIDRLRLELDEIWGPGAKVGTFEGKKMFVGIGRITAARKKILEEQPHFDSLPPGLALDGQFSANIYLSVPQCGGELELWNCPSLSQDDIHGAVFGKNWRAELPPSIRIAPCRGDLILINTRRPHAVRSFAEGTRVSIQCFIGYRKGQPLQLWS